MPWTGRNYKRDNWTASDPVNRAISCANSCLYGVCQAAILALGYSTGLGFVHTGKMLSFVYDIADLYKMEFSVPIAFQTVKEGTEKLDTRVRQTCREAFREYSLLRRIVDDLQYLLGEDATSKFDEEDDPPGGIWDPDGVIAGGVNFAEEQETPDDEVDSSWS